MDPVQTSYKKGVFIMNAQTTNSIIDMSALTATIEKNVATIAAQAAEKEKTADTAKPVNPDSSGINPVASEGRSMPVGLPNPKRFSYFFIRLIPRPLMLP